MSKEPQAIVALLDQQYEQLQDARRLVTSYVDASMKLQKDSQICCSCRVNQANEPECVLIYW